MPKPSGSFWRCMPVFDQTGRFSALKATALAGSTAPALWMAGEIGAGRWDLPSPFVPLIYHSGLWATYFVLITLLQTPLHRIGHWNALAQLRRLLGVTSCGYTMLHLMAWGGLRFWHGPTLGEELATRPSLWLAMVATIVLVALTATSLDRAIRAMGRRRWKQLHRLVYGATLLAIVHILMSPSSLQGLPFTLAGFYLWLMGWRVLDRYDQGTSPTALLLLGFATAAATLLLQPLSLATWQVEHAYFTPWEAMLDNFNPEGWADLGIPPIWLLLAFGLAIAAWARITAIAGVTTRHNH